MSIATTYTAGGTPAELRFQGQGSDNGLDVTHTYNSVGESFTQPYTAVTTSVNILLMINNTSVSQPQRVSYTVSCRAAPSTGSITISKAAVNGDDTFSFNSNVPGSTNPFTLSTAGGQASITFSSVTPGSYTVSEGSLPTGWSFTGLSCTGDTGGTATSVSGSTATIGLDAGENIACTFTNTKAAAPTTGTVVIRKTAVNGDDTFSFTSNVPGSSNPLTITTTGGTGSVTFSGVAPGSYTVTESALPTGWSFTSLSCSGDAGGTATSVNGQAATIGLDAGETITCTYTNTKQAAPTTGTVVIRKTAINGDDTFSFTSNVPGSSSPFTLVTNGGSASVTFSAVTPGSYTVTESALPTGWSFTSLSCSGDTGGTATSVNGQAATIGVDAGETITCTFTNTKSLASPSGTIVLRKTAINGNGAFTFTSNIPGAPSPISLSTAGGTADVTFSNIAPGTYTVTEDALPTGWTFSNLSCTGDSGGTATSTNGQTATIGLDGGETITCTYVNTFTAQQTPVGSITIRKVSVGGNATFSFTSSANLGTSAFDLTTNGGSAAQTFSNLAPGTYTVAEASLPTGWKFTSLTCVGDVSGNPGTTVVSGQSVSIGLDASEAITCTFTNTAQLQAPSSSITIVKRTVGRDGAFGFTSTIPGGTSFTLTTQQTLASQTFGNLAPGTFVITEATIGTGWKLSDVNCTGSSSTVINLAARSASVSLGSGAGVVCTFTNLFDEEGVRQRTTGVIRNFMNRRADLLTSEEPDRNRFFRRFADSLWSDGGSTGGAAPLSFTGMTGETFGRMAFATSISQVTRAMAASEARHFNDPRRPTVSNWNQDFDVWIEGHYSYFRDRFGGWDRSGRFGILYAGADYLLTPSILVGALVQVDLMDDRSRLASTEVDGTGWMVGPYVMLKLASNLFLDARVAWGQSTNQVSPFGTYVDTFETERGLARINVTGNWNFGSLRVTPSLGVTYFQERQYSYVDSLGVFIPSQTISLGRMTFGPEFAYRFTTAGGVNIEPQVSVTGIWDFKKDQGVSITGLAIGSDEIRAKVQAGVQISAPDGVSLRVTGSFDGIGDSALRVYGGQVWVNIPLSPRQ